MSAVTLYTIIRYTDCATYLRRIGFLTEGQIEYREVKPKRILVADIQAAVASRFEIPLFEMKSARRSWVVARPRQVAMYLSRKLTPKSLCEIGRMFGGRDHTTVIEAVNRIESLRASDPELDANIIALERELAVQG